MPLAKTTRFTFIGDLVISKDEARPLVKKMKGGNDKNLDMMALNFGIKAGNSVGYVEMFGMKTDKIFTMSSDNEKLEVEWENRNDPDTAKNIASYKKHFIQLEDEVKEFITEFDTIEYLENILKKIDKPVKIVGTVEKEPYVNKSGNKIIKNKYVVQNIYLARENEKPRLQIDMDLFFTKDSVDKSDFKKERIITVDGFIRQYVRNTKQVNEAIGEAGKEMFIPQQVVLSGAKLDFENEKDIKRWKIREKYLTVDNSKKLYHLTWRCLMISGAEEIEFDESQLTSAQLELVEAGLAKVEDFKPREAIMGERKNEIRLNTPLLTGDFENGIIEADFTLDELEDETMKFIEPEHLEDILKEEAEEDDKDEIPFDIDDAFDDDFGV